MVTSNWELNLTVGVKQVRHHGYWGSAIVGFLSWLGVTECWILSCFGVIESRILSLFRKIESWILLWLGEQVLVYFYNDVGEVLINQGWVRFRLSWILSGARELCPKNEDEDIRCSLLEVNQGWISGSLLIMHLEPVLNLMRCQVRWMLYNTTIHMHLVQLLNCVMGANWVECSSLVINMHLMQVLNLIMSAEWVED